MSRTPAAWALVSALTLVHVGTSVWAVATHHAPDLGSALVGERSAALRSLLGSRDAALVWHGEVWRLFTAPLVHAGGVYLLVNVVALWVLGQLAEPQLGWRRWLAVFGLGALGGGVLAQLTGVAHTDGASGGVYALLGAALAWRMWSSEATATERDQVRSLAVFIGLNVVWSLVSARLDAATHVGGLLVGLALVRRWET